MLKSNPNKPIKVLHLESSAEDAGLVAKQLESAGINLDIHLVSNRSGYIEAIKHLKPDLILSGFKLPGFDGEDALNLAKEHDPDTPFIFVTGKVGEEMAVTALKGGATDFILKHNLERLLPAVTRALEEKRISFERRKLFDALKLSEERYRTLIENIPVGIFRTTLSSPGKILQANLSIALMHGFGSVEEMLKNSVEELYLNPEDRNKLKAEAIKNKYVRNRLIKYRKVTGETFWGSISVSCHFDNSGNPDWMDGVLEDVNERVEKESELRRINEEHDLLINSLQSIIIGVSVNDRITHWNPFAEDVFGIKTEDIIGKRFFEAEINWNWELIYEAIGRCIITGKSIRVDDMKFENIKGKSGILGLAINPLKSGGDVLHGFMILGKDITDQKILENQILQSNKLEAIGQLAAGVAHEINTPLQYIGDNLKFINKSFVGLLNILDISERALKNTEDRDAYRRLVSQIEELSRKIKLPFLLEQMPKALEQSLEGIARVSGIVQSMKSFSHPGTGIKMPANINKLIENTVTVSRNEWKYDCELKLDLDLNIPEVPCFESELSQVILNLIINARDAVVEAKENHIIETGIIKIRTEENDSSVIIRVEDNGCGIPEDIQNKIFDPFFTTKEVGKGTGQGLPISHSIIVEKHGGMLYFESEYGKGTTFIIKLPVTAP